MNLRNLLKIELKKAFQNKVFLLMLGVGILIAMVSVIQNLPKYYKLLQNNAYAVQQGIQQNPMLPLFTPYSNWIGNDFAYSMTPLFYTLFPLLACLAYGWSYFGERKSGYVMNVAVRTRKKSQYSLAKYIAVFLSGGVVVSLPMLLNFLVISCFIPAYQPDLFYKMYYSVFSHFLRDWFYAAPLLFVFVILALNFLFGGLLAACSMAITFFAKNKFAVVLLPFMALFAVQYLQDNVWIFVSGNSISPMEFVRGYSIHTVSGLIILLWGSLLLLATLGIIWGKGARDDVL